MSGMVPIILANPDSFKRIREIQKGFVTVVWGKVLPGSVHCCRVTTTKHVNVQVAVMWEQGAKWKIYYTGVFHIDLKHHVMYADNVDQAMDMVQDRLDQEINDTLSKAMEADDDSGPNTW